MIGLNFIDLIVQKLQNMGAAHDWNAQNIANKINQWANYPSAIPIALLPDDLLDNVSTTRLIHEMLKRGFAVMRVPESGRPTALEPVK